MEESVTERYRNFGPRKPGPEPDPEPPSIFEPKRQVKGETGVDVHGDPVVRLSEHCYQELEKPVPTARDYGSSLPLMTKCTFPIGKREPRGDLFKHLKKSRPLPQSPPGTELKELPERLEENERE